MIHEGLHAAGLFFYYERKEVTVYDNERLYDATSPDHCKGDR